VVLDAPPTGRISQFLNVNSELAGLAKVGPVRSQADTVMTLLRSKRTAVHLVTVLEDMPVQETVDGVQQLHDAGLPVGGIVVNLVRPQDLDKLARTALLRRKVDPAGVAAALGVARVDDGATLVDSLLEEGHDHAQRRALEDEQRKLVAGIGAPTYELPKLAAGVDLTGLYELAAQLCEQGLA
jgi:anion-transporting  ArsA/GET3 family ATPase